MMATKDWKATGRVDIGSIKESSGTMQGSLPAKDMPLKYKRAPSQRSNA